MISSGALVATVPAVFFAINVANGSTVARSAEEILPRHLDLVVEASVVPLFQQRRSRRGESRAESSRASGYVVARPAAIANGNVSWAGWAAADEARLPTSVAGAATTVATIDSSGVHGGAAMSIRHADVMTRTNGAGRGVEHAASLAQPDEQRVHAGAVEALIVGRDEHPSRRGRRFELIRRAAVDRIINGR